LAYQPPISTGGVKPEFPLNRLFKLYDPAYSPLSIPLFAAGRVRALAAYVLGKDRQ
jgi:hypothetical protein